MDSKNTGPREPGWSHFRHGADIGIRGVGRTRAEAFEQAAVALIAVICEPSEIRAEERVEVHCESPDPEILFVEWIDALVFEIATRRMLFSRFRVTLDGGNLNATLHGESIDLERHAPAVEVKGATLTALEVRQQTDGSWLAQCVVDV